MSLLLNCIKNNTFVQLYLKLYMKLILRIFFFLTISTKLFSQTPVAIDKVTYLDSSWVETNAENSKYTRVVENYYSDQKLYVFKDYFKSKKIRMIGSSSDREVLRQEGQFIYYYENGNKKSTVTYSNKKKKAKSSTGMKMEA
jgi:antitoxin component YwqK of YwqJK toxin-antitoxin module